MKERERERRTKLGVRGTLQVAYKPLIISMHYQRNSFVLVQKNLEFILKANQRKIWRYEFLFLFLFISSTISRNHNNKSQRWKAEMQECKRGTFCSLCCGFQISFQLNNNDSKSLLKEVILITNFLIRGSYFL